MRRGGTRVFSVIIGHMSDLKTPPNNVEAERAVLGSILLDTAGRSDDRVMDECRTRGIVPEAFYDPCNRAIYTVMLEMAMASKPFSRWGTTFTSMTACTNSRSVCSQLISA